MSHRSRGFYRLLESASVYERFQKLLGADAVRKRFVNEFLRPREGARLLDIGCGTGSLLDYLPEPLEYVGFDLNPDYIESARLRYGHRGQFHCAKVGEEAEVIGERLFDFVVAKGMLHHLTDDDAHHLLGMARRHLAPNGTFISFDNVFHDGQSWMSRTLTALDRGGSVRSPEQYQRLIEAHFPYSQTWLLTDMLPFPYSHFIVRASIEDRRHHEATAPKRDGGTAAGPPNLEGEAAL